MKIVCPKVPLLLIEGYIVVMRFFEELIVVLGWGAELETVLGPKPLTVGVCVESVDQLIEVVKRGTITMSEILSVHDQNLIGSSRLFVLFEMLHHAFADAIIYVLYMKDRPCPDVFEPVDGDSLRRAVPSEGLMPKYARVCLLVCSVGKSKLWLPDELLVPLEQSVLFIIFVDAGENGRFEAHFRIQVGITGRVTKRIQLPANLGSDRFAKLLPEPRMPLFEVSNDIVVVWASFVRADHTSVGYCDLSTVY